MQNSRNAMVDRRNKIGMGQRFALVIGDGNQRHVAEAGIEGLRAPQNLSAVQCGQGPCRQRAEKREMEQIDVKMENVELIRAFSDLIKHEHEVWTGVVHRGLK